LIEPIKPVVGGAPVERTHLRDVLLQRGKARLPPCVAVGLDLRQIGERRANVTDRRHLEETAGAIVAKLLVAQ